MVDQSCNIVQGEAQKDAICCCVYGFFGKSQTLCQLTMLLNFWRFRHVYFAIFVRKIDQSSAPHGRSLDQPLAHCIHVSTIVSSQQSRIFSLVFGPEIATKDNVENTRDDQTTPLPRILPSDVQSAIEDSPMKGRGTFVVSCDP